MTNRFTLGMTKATELTKAGKLAEATALIQSLLTNKVADTAVLSDASVIDGVYTRLDDTDEGAPAVAEHEPAQRHTARASLGATLRKIAAGGMPGHARLNPAPAPLPGGAQFITLAHSNSPDQRTYKLYVPANRPSAAMPLIVMLHGCTQSPDDFAAGTGMNALAEKHCFLVAYPAQPSGANANKCWNWFRAEDQQRDHGEPALIAGLTRDILRDYPVDPARIYVAGLSAGGAAAAIVGAAYPDLFSAVGVHSGLAVGSASDIPQAFSAMRSGSSGAKSIKTAPTIVFHGTADTTVSPHNGEAVIAQVLATFGKLAVSETTGKSPGGRSFRQTRYCIGNGPSICEHWEIVGAGHAWSGGEVNGSYTDPNGPSASAEMVRFFWQHANQ